MKYSTKYSGGLSALVGASLAMVYPFIILLVTRSPASGVESVSQVDDACATYDSCNVSDFFRTCSCDEDCSLYGTCCFDAPAFDNKNSGTGFQCRVDMLAQPVFFRKHCSDSFAGSPEVKRSCESADNTLSDLMLNIPVSSTKTMVTYWSWNCAVCNGETEADLSFWTVQASCPLGKSSKRFDVDVYRKNMVYDHSTDKWGIYEDNSYKACSVSFYQPPFLTGRLRYCAPNMMSDCPPSWKDDDVRSKCHTLHGERKKKGSSVYYKNAHCATCNGVPISELECFGRTYKSFPPVSDISTMKIIFNLNPSKGEHAKSNMLCFNNKRYDPFLKKCRNIQCGISKDDTLDVCQYSSSSPLLPSLLVLTFSAVAAPLVNFVSA